MKRLQNEKRFYLDENGNRKPFYFLEIYLDYDFDWHIDWTEESLNRQEGEKKLRKYWNRNDGEKGVRLVHFNLINNQKIIDKTLDPDWNAIEESDKENEEEDKDFAEENE